ncbi:hypothetical protein GYH30_020967 [Glycine max]|nr:hypothetical protein GYH30_020967 [Glycine max]
MSDHNHEISTSADDGNDSLNGHIISTTVGGKNGKPKQTKSYIAERIVGTGSFGIVFLAKCLETGEPVAIKKVLQDKRYKNRELQLMRLMDHPNVISLKHRFFSTTSADELFLNLVMEYVPESMYRVSKFYSNTNQSMPLIYVKLYMHQIFSGLAYIHTVPGVCHRDLKPQNILVDPLTHQVKICDFGSAKVLVKGKANISHICSLFYRAPELMFGATACAHPFFDELREPNAHLPDGRPFPPLFNLKQELSGASPELIDKLIPDHVKRQIGLQHAHLAGFLEHDVKLGKL